MKKWVICLILYFICINAYAKDITLTKVPDGLDERIIAEFASVAIERYANALLGANQDSLTGKKPVTQKQIDDAKKVVDDFRKANNLAPKFEVVQ